MNREELIKRAEAGRKIGEFLALPDIAESYSHCLREWTEALCDCDPHDTAAMVTLKGMRTGLQAFWGLLEGMREIGADAEKQLSGEASDETMGRVIP